MSHAETMATSAAKRATGALERVSELENALEQVRAQLKEVGTVINNISAFAMQQRQELNRIADQCNAAILIGESVSEIIGAQQVMAKMDEVRAKRAAEFVARQEEANKQLLNNGLLEVAEKVEDSSLVVGRELTLTTTEVDGQPTVTESVVPPGRIQFHMYSVGNQDFREKMLGAKVGDKVTGFTADELKNKAFEVLEVYRDLEKFPKEVPAATEPSAS